VNRAVVLSLVISAIVRLLGRFVRLRIHDLAGYFDATRSDPLILAAWHNRILGLLIAFSRNRGRVGRRLVVLTSASRDGGLVTAVVNRFGIGAVRGSTSRRGAAAVLQLARELSAGNDTVITPDGPRGPRYSLGPGIVFLAQKTGRQMIWAEVTYSRCWELKSWDRFRIPKPFSRVEVTLRPLGVLAPASSQEIFEAERTRLEAALRSDHD
jgi:lysophospholipid acyltransferase (LPLAT)-like uncharacterized protein